MTDWVWLAELGGFAIPPFSVVGIVELEWCVCVSVCVHMFGAFVCVAVLSSRRKVEIHNVLLLENGFCEPWCVAIIMCPNTWNHFHYFFITSGSVSCICFSYLLNKVQTGKKVLIHCIGAQSEYLICLTHFLFSPRGFDRRTVSHLSETEALFLCLLL